MVVCPRKQSHFHFHSPLTLPITITINIPIPINININIIINIIIRFRIRKPVVFILETIGFHTRNHWFSIRIAEGVVCVLPAFAPSSIYH